MMKDQASFIAWRFYLIIFILICSMTGLVVRVIDLTVCEKNFLRKQGDERSLRLMHIPAYRGMILDRNNSPLAVSTVVYAVWMNPQIFNIDKNRVDLLSLSRILDLNKNSILDIFKRAKEKNKEFVYLKRGLDPKAANEIKNLSVTGIYIQPEHKRYYPEGEVTAHVIGLTNIDDDGQEGIELGFNDWLQGETGKKWIIKDRLGNSITDVATLHSQKPGNDLILSIDKRIQYLAYRELLAGVIENQADSGTVIVLDVKTGEVLAMVNQPAFNPNNRSTRNNDNFKNRAVTDTFEPGSTIKAFSVASALDSGKYQPDTIVDTSPGWMQIGHNVVHDEKNNGQMTLARILQISSNMGMTKVMLNMPKIQLWDLLHRLGFGEITGIAYPGEQSGVLLNTQNWGDFKIATLGFGYGLSVTALQLARAYAVIANDGIKLPISLLRLDTVPQGKKVLESKVAKQMLDLLESVIQKGSTGGARARVSGYRVAGKTGTAKVAGQNGYQHQYISSFVGIAPLNHPRIVVAVVIHHPKGKNYYGGYVSGPIFSRVMSGTLRILNIPPDDLL